MDRATIIDRLKALGADDESAAKRADAILAEARNAGLVVAQAPRRTFVIEQYTPPPGAWSFPIRIVLPWSNLISDNRKYCPALRGGKPAIILTVEYRAAKRAAGVTARQSYGDGIPYPDPIRLEAKVYFPNDDRRDAHNFQKCAHDALKGIVYADDSQLRLVQWEAAGVNVDAPRAEITIMPYDIERLSRWAKG